MSRRFPIVFVFLLLALFALELTAPVQAYFVRPWTDGVTWLSGALASAIDSGVATAGSVIMDRQSGFAVRVEAGCNGVEAMLVLAAGMLAFKAPWRFRLVGLLAGTAAVQFLNLVRVVSLFYLGQWNLKAFEFAHLYLWQALIMLDVLIVWLLWLRWVGRAPAAA
jgi:exosortase H (IPTLxxWG-CTERM-specific)